MHDFRVTFDSARDFFYVDVLSDVHLIIIVSHVGSNGMGKTLNQRHKNIGPRKRKTLPTEKLFHKSLDVFEKKARLLCDGGQRKGECLGLGHSW
jgi:hypothetical protein